MSNFAPCLVDVQVKSRILTIKGKRGSVTKNFRHAAVEIDKLKQNTPKRKGDYIRIRKWFGSAGDAASAGTLRGIIKSMIVGVTEVSKHSFRTVSATSLGSSA